MMASVMRPVRGHAWVGVEVEGRDDFRELTDSDSADDATDGAVHLLRDVGELQLERDGGGCCRRCWGSHGACLSGLVFWCVSAVCQPLHHEVSPEGRISFELRSNGLSIWDCVSYMHCISYALAMRTAEVGCGELAILNEALTR